jgi:SAM-dependent methyltransferase
MTGHVDAIDSDAAVIRAARDCSVRSRNIRFVEADFMRWKADVPYDFVSMVAVLHHLPFGAALIKAADLLRPGGALVVLGLDREPSLLHLAARCLIAVPMTGYYRIVRRASPVGAPTLDPTMTLSEIRRDASRLLPGAIVRRHALLRYSLVWTKP